MGSRQFKRVAFDFHFAAPQRVAADDAGGGIYLAAAGEAEFFAQMIFLRRAWREQFHALGDFHETLAALAVFVARSGNLDAEPFRAFKKRLAGSGVARMKVEM